jgi:hypothetical protein
MGVNMSGFDKNPFKVGDKVKVKSHILRTWPSIFSKYLPVECAIITRIVNNHVLTDVDNDPAHFEHFELYKEPCNNPEETMNQQTQQKTKRVPFSEESWLKHKNAKVIWTPTETEILYFDKWGGYDFIGVYKPPGADYTATTFMDADFPNMALEIPVTTKRIPFNPELKDAKVVCKHTSDEFVQWVQLVSGVVCGVIRHESEIGLGAGFTTELYHPNALEMEIEEEG